MKVADIMTRRLITVRPETSVADAVHLMLQDEISGLPVVDRNGRLVGIVTEGDFQRRVELGTERNRRPWLAMLIDPNRLAEDYVHSHARKVGEAMTCEVVTIGPDATLDEVVATMERHRVKRLPVTQDGRLVGIVSRADLLRALGAISDGDWVSTRSVSSDTALRQRILAEIEKQPWAPATTVSVVVWDGSAHLWGTATDDKQRQALTVLAENVPGVEEVRDHLVVIEPIPAFVS